MPHGIYFKTEIFLRGYNFSSIHHLEDEIETLEENLKDIEKLLVSFYSQTPVQDPEEPSKVAYDALKCVREEMEAYRDYCKDLNLMYLLKTYLQENPEVDIKTLFG